MNVIFIISIVVMVLGFAGLVYVLLQSERQRKLKSFHIEIDQHNSLALFKITEFFAKVFSTNESEIATKLIDAGLYDSRFKKYFVVVKYSTMMVGLGVLGALLFFHILETKKFLMFASIWVVAILMGPDAYLSFRKKTMQRSISNKLPYMLDLLAVCVQTGMTIEAAISYLALEFGAFDKDLSFMLKQVDERARLVGLEQALSELYTRVPTNEIRSFVMTINQSLQYGSSIYSVLTTLSADIREVQLLHVEEKIGQLSAKMSIPLIVFIMVPIVILIAAPGIMRLMQNAHF